jgi:ADP-ribose pyrophosphatase
MEKWLKQKVAHRGPIFSVISGEAILENGKIVNREVVQHQGSVAIVPIINDSVILVRQFRIAVEKEMLEIPAGRIDPDEDPSTAAERELEEETGYKSLRLVQGPVYYSLVGFVNEKIHLFFAFDLEKLDVPRNGDDDVRLKYFSLTEIEQQLNLYKFDDSKTIIGLRETFIHLQNNKKMIDEKKLYSWYSEENHKYNTIIWQFPAAIIGLNLLAVNGIISNASNLLHWQLIVALIFMWLLNTILLYTVAKHTYHQRGFTKSLEDIQEVFKIKHPELESLFVTFPKKRGLYKLFKLKATWVLVIGLAILNLGYLAYLVVILV